MPNNYIFRPEYFIDILIDRDTFEKWELDERHSLYLWIYYHIGDVEQPLNILNNFYEDINFDEIWDSVKFSPIRDYKVLDKKCKDCTYNIFCNGGCFVEKQIVNSKYDKCCDPKCYRYLGV